LGGERVKHVKKKMPRSPGGRSEVSKLKNKADTLGGVGGYQGSERSSNRRKVFTDLEL